jgi:hypothetical protein
MSAPSREARPRLLPCPHRRRPPLQPFPPRTTRRGWRPAPRACSLALVGASLLLNARGEETVTLPILGTPLPPLCAMKGLAGWDCPGCGLTRSFVSLAHGDFARAWHFNPAGWLIFAAILLQIPFRAVQLWRLRRGLRELDAPWLIVLAWLIVVALLGQWAARLFAAWM